MENTPIFIEKNSTPRSTGALILFLLFALPMPLCLLTYHFVLWSVEQTAIITLSLKQLAWSGVVGLAAQAVLMSLLTGLLWKFTKDARFKPMYASMFGAALMAFPALGLKFLSPNADQLGGLIQTALSLLGAVILLRKKKIDWDFSALPFGLLIGGAGVLPYLLYGSFGSLADTFFAQDGDPTKAAHVINNSWGCPPLEGCDPNALLYAANHLRTAGIFVVVSAGNDGPNCETVESPLALYDSVFSVGAIDQFGNMADFSSRGPVTADGSGRVKPDIVAPGVDVFSSLPQGTYGVNSGTSMAGPHLVGVVALLWSAQPKLIGDIDATEKILTETAQPYTGETSLGCFSGDAPSNAYGYGVVDVYAAVKKALGK
ncbi:MAG: hypothetical protein Fur002_14590 [Anaerolineales bacterium]